MPAARFLIATDLSKASERAAASAAAIAERTGAALDFFCAVPRSAARDLPDLLDTVRGGVQELAKSYESKGLEVSCHVAVAADVAEAIVLYAEKMDADLIVTAPQGVTGWKKLVLGSVTEQVMRLAPSMLLIARPRPASVPQEHVLLAVDRSPGGARATRLGIDLARSLGAKLTVLTVIRPPGALVQVEEALEAASSGRRRRARERKAFKAFEEWLEQFDLGGIDASVSVVEGHPPEEIVAAARALGATLVVMGTAGKSRTKEFFVGSVARAVATVAPVSVLLIRGRPKKRVRGKFAGRRNRSRR